MQLSVVIPVFNAETYLAECLESVLSQDVEEMEVLCVDDASTDGSVAVIERFQKKDPRVRLLKNSSNLYAGACRNRGIESALGEFVHFLDADDLVEPGVYKKVLGLAQQFGVDVVKGRGSRFVMSGSEKKTCSAGPLLAMRDVPESDFGKPFSFLENPSVLTYVSVVPWNGIYRRSLLMEHHIRFNSLVCVNDRSFYNEVTVAANKILLTKESFVRYRQTGTESLMGRRARNFDCEFASYRLVEEQLNRYGVTGASRRIVLEREFRDVMYWYKKYHRLPEGVGAKVEQGTREFLDEIEMGEFAESDPKASFLRTYRYIIGKENLSDKLRRWAVTLVRKIYK